MTNEERTRELCFRETTLTEADIEIIIEQSKMLQTIADMAQANVFIDCPTKDKKTVIVVAEAEPTTIESLYQESVCEKLIYENHEPAVFRVLRSGKPVMVHRALTHEGKHVHQNVMPIKNSSNKTIGMLIAEKDITMEIKRENELANLTETTEEFSRTFWDLIRKDPSIPDVIDEALILYSEDGRLLYANNFAIGMFINYSNGAITNENYLEMTIDQAFPFLNNEFRKYSYGVNHWETEYKGKVFSIQVISIEIKGEANRSLMYIRDLTDLRDKERQLLVKSAVIQEIHHRVKNNLQTVASLLRLQMRRGVPQDMKKLYNESLNRIMSIATVHEYLSFSKIERVYMNEVIDKILSMLNYNRYRDNCSIEFTKDIERIQLSSKQAISLALILTELVQNSLKHGFEGREHGIINIRFYSMDNIVVLHVEDNGIGLSDLEQNVQLGLEIVKNLTEYDLAGTFSIQDKETGGTIAKVEFPFEWE